MGLVGLLQLRSQSHSAVRCEDYALRPLKLLFLTTRAPSLSESALYESVYNRYHFLLEVDQALAVNNWSDYRPRPVRRGPTDCSQANV
jgi:hypothetical protein